MPLADKPLGDHEFPSDDDLLDDRDDPVEMACPQCGAPVIEDTPKCPHCGDWITPRDPSSAGWRRTAFVAVVILMLLSLLIWLF